MAPTNDPVVQRIASLGDEELLRMAETTAQKPGDYTVHAVAVVTAEIDKRGGLERINTRIQEAARERPDRQPSLAPAKTIRKSAITGFVFALLYGMTTLFLFSVQPAYGFVTAVITALFLTGSVLALTGHYSGARACYLIGGILGFPFGVFMIGAALNIRDAARALQLDDGASAAPHL